MPSDAEITFADHAGRFYARRFGMAPVVGRLIGYLGVCDPREQSIGELAEALLASRDSARANDLFRSLEPSWAAHPESRWRAFALMARFGPQSADRANEAIGQLEALWGHEAFLQYLKAFASPFAVQFR